jgi:tetratricopeptide (TPR) repeat protein
MKFLISLLFLILSSSIFANNISNLDTKKQLQEPLIERYILDELKQIRIDNQQIKVDVAEKIAASKIITNDRAIEYTTNTLNSIFYIVTIAASFLVILGWRSLSDVKNTVDNLVSKKIGEITDKYEQRLDEMEVKIKSRSNEIIANQEEISNTNLVHSLWMRAGLEKSNREKLKIYDQILEIKPNDVEVMTYKADVLLDIDKVDEALKLSNLAIDNNDDYALAYWQRACAYASLSRFDEAIEDIKKSISISTPLKNKITEEVHFENLKNIDEFINLVEE